MRNSIILNFDTNAEGWIGILLILKLKDMGGFMLGVMYELFIFFQTRSDAGLDWSR